MYIVTVIPITKGTIKGSLTYFSKENVPEGSIVSVPLRKRKIHGIVMNCQNAQKSKYDIKSLAYQMRKVEKIKNSSFLSDGFIRSVNRTADYYVGNQGSVLATLIPSAILENSGKINYSPNKIPPERFYETALLQSDDEERYAVYKSLIREEFARGKSVFFCLPTIEDLKNTKTILEKGIEKYTFILHSFLSKKEILFAWQNAIKESHPVLIIATGSFLSIPRDDLGTIILEKESSRAYKMQTRPFLDIRTFAEILAKETNRRLILGDTLLRIETLWEEKNGKYAELSPIKFRSLSASECLVIDMRTPKDFKKEKFTIFSEKLKEILKEAKSNNEKTFLFTGRKGLHPITICEDCGTTVVCKNCGAPVVLYSKSVSQEKKNLFVCHHCGERRDAKELCEYCKGWRLNPMGIGVETVLEEVKNLFPETKTFLIDKDHTKTQKQAEKERDSFYNNPGSILIGTEMALTYLNQKIENVAVISVDSFFSIPDFRINEKIFQIMLSLRSISEKNMLIQTRQENSSPGWKVLEYAIRGNLADFYRDEIEERKQMNYPPFATYIKLTMEGEKNAVKKKMEDIKKILEPNELLIFDAWNPGSNKKYSVHGLLTIKKGMWIEKELLEKLKNLPPYVMIKVDPDSFL